MLTYLAGRLFGSRSKPPSSPNFIQANINQLHNINHVFHFFCYASRKNLQFAAQYMAAFIDNLRGNCWPCSKQLRCHCAFAFFISKRVKHDVAIEKDWHISPVRHRIDRPD